MKEKKDEKLRYKMELCLRWDIFRSMKNQEQVRRFDGTVSEKNQLYKFKSLSIQIYWMDEYLFILVL